MGRRWFGAGFVVLGLGLAACTPMQGELAFGVRFPTGFRVSAVPAGATKIVLRIQGGTRFDYVAALTPSQPQVVVPSVPAGETTVTATAFGAPDEALAVGEAHCVVQPGVRAQVEVVLTPRVPAEAPAGSDPAAAPVPVTVGPSWPGGVGLTVEGKRQYLVPYGVVATLATVRVVAADGKPVPPGAAGKLRWQLISTTPGYGNGPLAQGELPLTANPQTVETNYVPPDFAAIPSKGVSAKFVVTAPWSGGRWQGESVPFLLLDPPGTIYSNSGKTGGGPARPS